MSDTPSEFVDNGERPTEELYIELCDLEAIESRAIDDDAPEVSGPPENDSSGIRERIAHLRALLSDRGIIQD